MMSDRRNWRRWNTRKNKCTHESLAVELLVCLLAIRTSRRINDTFCPRAGESGESAPPEWILSTVPGTNLLPLSPLQVDWMNTTQLNTIRHFVFFFLSRYVQVHNDVPAVSAADKQTYAQCRTYSSEKPESHLSISCLGKAADLILLWEFRVVFKILNAAVLRVRLGNWRRGWNWKGFSNRKQKTEKRNWPGQCSQAGKGLEGRSRPAALSSLSASPLQCLQPWRDSQKKMKICKTYSKKMKICKYAKRWKYAKDKIFLRRVAALRSSWWRALAGGAGSASYIWSLNGGEGQHKNCGEGQHESFFKTISL